MTEHTASFQVTAGQPAEQQRTFWPTDYGRLARAIRQVRRDSGNDVLADDMTAAVAGVLAEDSAEFDADRFARATYDVPGYVRQFADAVRRSRHVMGRSWEAKGAEHQQIVDALASALSALLAEEVPGFDAERFLGSTAPPQAPAGRYAPGEDEDEDEDEDEAGSGELFYDESED